MSRKQKIIRKIALVVGAIFLVLLTFPMAIKDRLVSIVKSELNEKLAAQVDFSDAHVNLLANFPNIRLGLDSLSITGVDQFEGIRLLESSKIRMTFGLVSILKNIESPVVKDLSLFDPQINVLILEDGIANYEILYEDTDPTESEDEFQIQLKSYRIENGGINYLDRQENITLSMDRVNHQGSGVLSAEVFDLDTKWQIQHLSLSADGLTYIRESQVEAEALLAIDLATSTYTFKENLIKINDLGIRLDGSLRQEAEALSIDLVFGAPSSEIRQFLSMIPGVYRQGLSGLETKGNMAVKGRVLGSYSEENSLFPTFQLDLKVEDGFLRSQQTTETIEDLNADIHVKSATGELDDLVIDGRQLTFVMQEVPFDAQLQLTNLVSNPKAEGHIKGQLDLAVLSSIIPISNIENLEGKILADLEFGANYNDVERRSYDEVKLAGQLSATDLAMSYADYPKISAERVQIALSPESTQLHQTTIFLGESDLTVRGSLTNLLSLLKPNEGFEGLIAFHSSLLDLNPWSAEDSDLADGPDYVSLPAESAKLRVDGTIEKLLYQGHTLRDIRCQGDYNQGRLNANPLHFKIKNSDLTITGSLSGLSDYLVNNGTLEGSANISSTRLDFDALFDQSENDEESAPYPLPDAVKMDLNLTADHLTYDGLDLQDATGHLILADQELIMEHASATTLGGTLGFTGRYQTLPNEHPVFNMKFDADDLDFQKTFEQIAFLEKLAPIGTFLQGQLRSDLVLEGNLQKDRLVPDLMSLSGSGLLETINSAISHYVPLEKVAELLGIDDLKDLKKINSKNWFSLEKGRLDVEPFEVVLEEIDLTLKVTGSQFLNGEMDYLVVARVPRELLRQNQVSGQLDHGYGLVLKRAQELGLNLDNSDYITLQIAVAGVYNNPTTLLKVVDAEGRTADQVIKQALTEKTAEIKDSIQTAAEEKLESAKDSLLKEGALVVDGAQKRILEQAKDKVGNYADTLLRNQGSELLDSVFETTTLPSIGDSTEARVSDIKKKLKDFNPFGKKKNKGEHMPQDSVAKK